MHFGHNRTVTSAIHTKAHRSLAQVDQSSTEDIRQFHGNRLADEYAKAAASEECAQAQLCLAVKTEYRLVETIGLHIGRCLALFPSFKQLTAGVPHTKRPRAKILRPSRVHGHDLVWFGSSWACSSCSARSTRSAGPSFVCPGPTRYQALLDNRNGHDLFAIGDLSFVLVFCRRCGAYSSSRFANLMRACPGIPRSPAGLTRLVKSRHPVTGAQLSRPARL